MKLIIKNPETGKYFTDSYRDDFWSIEIEDACVFEDELALKKCIESHCKFGDRPFDEVKTIIIETVYKF